VTETSLQETRRYLRRRLPKLQDAPLLETRVCQYENTSNGDFLVDRHPEIGNVWLVGGGSGHGFKHGPAVGQYVTERISDAIEPETRFSSTKSYMFSSERFIEVQSMFAGPWFIANYSRDV